jgi:DNA-binding response OmpR family regulator
LVLTVLDYLDKALIEAAAASFHFEQVGNTRFLARVENNLGFLYFTLGQYRDAHQHFDRARYLFLETKDLLIIVDTDLPGITGLELVRRARNMARWRATPIIMLSGEECENEAWRAGMSDFLRKPQDISQLTSRINRLLASAKDQAE